MREILFRGKLSVNNGTLHKNDWVYGDYVRLHDGDKITKHFIYGFGEIDKNTLGQFTGRLDKNGKKIFEGDFVCRIADNENGLIVWDDKRCGFYIKPLTMLGRAMYDPYYKMNANKLEVIGNIYDNPELLEVENEKRRTV